MLAFQSSDGFCVLGYSDFYFIGGPDDVKSTFGICLTS